MYMHALTFLCTYKIPVTLSEHYIHVHVLQSARFKNTIIELLTTSTHLGISKRVGALKQLFLKKKGYRSPLLFPLPKICAS